MEQNLNHNRERGGWAPLVGVALAALMIGSLMLFSTIAQRTSLEGFAERGLVVEAPAGDSSRAITVSPVAEASNDSGDAASTGAVAAVDSVEPTQLIFEDAPVQTVASTTAVEVAGADAPDTADRDVLGSPDSAADRLAVQDTAIQPFAFKISGGSSPKNDETGKANDAKQRDRVGKSTKERKAKQGRGPKAKQGRGPKAKQGHRRNGPPSHANGGRGRSASASSSSARPAKSRSARPAPAARPARPASRPAPRSAHASNHSNQKGNGHSKGRGRGHRH